MIIGGALALLSACYNCSLPKGSGSGSELAIARAQIRMTIGRLRDLGEVWPRTGKNLKEVQMVASHVLELGLGQGNKAVSSPLVGGTGSEPGIVVGDGEEGFAFPDIEDLDFCGWCNLDPGLWGMAMADGDGFVI